MSASNPSPPPPLPEGGTGAHRPLRSGGTSRSGDPLDVLSALVERRTDPADVPNATDIASNVPIYDGEAVERAARDPAATATLLDEWGGVLRDGAGVFAVRRALADTVLLDAVTREFEAVMEEESGSGPDHFAAAGANVRIWNAHEKLALRAPALFVRYNAVATTALASRAWLGPDYQLTAQVNLVPPGGAAQAPHRDYHLGFMDAGQAARYPAHVHALSPFLTLQGAIAHSDMPIESGPTQLLPFSQHWPSGYTASSREEVRALFAERAVQLALGAGDALFFNPALLHAAGENRTSDVRRLANLLQVSSPFGRAMEIVDRTRLCRTIYPELLRQVVAGRLDAFAREAVVASSAEGYPFPANLDLGWEGGGLRPPSQQDLLRAALADEREPALVASELDAQAARSRA